MSHAEPPLPPTPLGRKRLARRTSSIEVLHDLALRDETDTQIAVAYNPAADALTLTTLAALTDNWRVLQAVARHPATPPEVLVRLVGDPPHAPHDRVLSALSRRPDADEGLLARLAQSKAADVRRGVAYNRNCTSRVLELLAGDPDPQVRAAAAGHNRLPDQDLVRLAGDPSPDVQYRAAWRGGREQPAQDVPIEVLRTMSASTDLRVRKRTSRMAGTLPVEIAVALAHDDDKWIRCNIVDRPDCPKEALLVLAEDTDVDVRARAARHERADEDVLTVALSRRAGTVGYAVWRRGADWQRWMLTHSDVKVRKHCVVQSLDARDIDLLSALSGDADPSVRAAVAKACREAQILEALATDPITAVRRAVAENTSVPPSAIALLVEDPVPSVRSKASEAFMKALGRGSIRH